MSTTQPQLGRLEVGDQELQRELERRLELIDSARYDDPARRDLPRADIVALAAVVIAVDGDFYLALY